MKKLLLCAAVLVLMGGCPVPTTNLDPGRMEVNDHLRTACADFAPTDADIEALMIVIENEREKGRSKADVIDTLGAACYLPGCLACSMAMVEQIYGE